jgi:hypothetical protein
MLTQQGDSTPKFLRTWWSKLLTITVMMIVVFPVAYFKVYVAPQWKKDREQYLQRQQKVQEEKLQQDFQKWDELRKQMEGVEQALNRKEVELSDEECRKLIIGKWARGGIDGTLVFTNEGEPIATWSRTWHVIKYAATSFLTLVPLLSCGVGRDIPCEASA